MGLSAEMNIGFRCRQVVFYLHGYSHSKGMKRGHAGLQVSLAIWWRVMGHYDRLGKIKRKLAYCKL